MYRNGLRGFQQWCRLMRAIRGAAAAAALLVGQAAVADAVVSLSGSGEPMRVSISGFVKAAVIASDRAMESFGQENMSAPTAAGNPALSLNPDWARSSFQVAQSRFAIKASAAQLGLMLMEFDFIDFSKGSPTTTAVPRLRRALVSKTMDDLTFTLGQDWDLFSPLAPHTYNFVGHYFQTGDLGFMRLQATVQKKIGSFEHAVALGFPAANTSSRDASQELSVAPTLALRSTFSDGTTKTGVASIGGAVKNSLNLNQTLYPYAFNLFWQSKFAGWESTAEIYYGKSLANLSLQGLSFSTTPDQVEEAGGFANFRKPLSGGWGSFFGAGFARILSGDVSPSYTISGSGASATRALANPGRGLGIRDNSTLRVGLDYKASEQSTVFLETGVFFTNHQIAQADLVNYDSYQTARFIEMGLKQDF